LLAPQAHYYVGNEIIRSSFYQNRWSRSTFSDHLQIVTTISGGLYKGLETIVSTSEILISNDFKDFKWIVVGLSDTDTIAQIVKKWKKINYPNLNIFLIGSKNENEIVDILLQSDIYCQVSHIENSPNSLCEAMLLGMPIIASFAGGTDSILENKKEGVLVQDGDPYSLAGAIVEMSNNYDLAVSYAKSAVATANKRHDKKNIVLNLLEIYKELLCKKY
jgi:glycosyltransferase involved in cell wall biosynthesis